MKKLVTILFFVLLFVSCDMNPPSDPPSISNIPFVPGIYNINRNMYTIQMENMTMSLIIDKLTINDNFSITIDCIWKSTYSSGAYTSIRKSSDNGNTDMYIKDGSSNRYDVVSTTGAAFGGCTLSYNSSASGGFVFSQLPISTKKITFYDDDQGGSFTFNFN